MFKKINLLTESFEISNALFSKAMQSNREFGITIDGEIDYEFNRENIYIFWGKGSIFQKNEPLGKGYSVKLNFVKAIISAENSWNRFKDINRENSLYEDISSDGIDSFKDEILENIGWHIVEFDMTYRDLVEHLEEFGEGAIVSIERDEPYMFDGLGFVKKVDLAKSREILFNFAKEKISSFIEDNREDFQKYGFSREQEEALKFFSIEKAF
jgi:hypothetical protein